ncbi:MAG: type II toxin-antitoxin system prevent-host-death family antitoxin, partial [Ruminococcus sp.]|nr:type II toxin-antitoxin system prevent-host-death family antitoxin [Ruminococcus sp.]
SEPVFITKNGKGDLAVMSIEVYEQLKGRLELYGLLEKGLEDERQGKVRTFSEALEDIRKGISG